MARAKNLNDKPSEYIKENILQENPEGLPPCEDKENELVVVKHIPEMKKIQFINQRDPGQELMFHYHSKTHHLKHYTLYHGKEYTLPIEIIEHLESCAEPQYGYRPGPNGHPEMYTKGYKYIFRCQPVKPGMKAA
jgi:hypothetical protein